MATPLSSPIPEGKMMSITEGKIVDIPEGLKTEIAKPAKEEESKEEEEEEEETGKKEDADNDKKEAEKKDEAKKDEAKSDDDEEEEEKEEDKKEAEKKDDKKVKEEAKKKDEKKDDDKEPPELSSLLKNKYSEKYQIESEEDLDFILENTQKLADELEAERKKAKGTETLSPKKQAIVKFLEPWPEDKFGEGMQAVASIMQMDVANLADKKAMEEVFILDHPHLTREEAKDLFDDEWNEKYEINKEDFDDDEKFNKRKKTIDLRIKDKGAQDKKILLQKQEELKALKQKAEEKKPESQEAQIPQKTVSEYTSLVDKFFDGPKVGQQFTGFVFQDDDDPSLSYKITFEPEKIEELREIVKDYLKKPASYDKSGKIPNFDPASLTRGLAKLVYSDWYDEQHFLNAKNLARVMKAEQIAGKKPTKKSSGAGETKGVSIEAQFGALAKQEREKKRK